jgi:hypothetical protein
MRKIIKSLFIITILCITVGCNDKGIKRNDVEELPFTENNDRFNGEETYYTINEIALLDIDEELKKHIEINMIGLSVDVLNNLEDYMLLKVSFLGRIEKGTGMKYRNWEEQFFNKINFVKGDELLENSGITVGSVINIYATEIADWIEYEYTTDLGETVNAILIQKDYASDEDIQIKYNTGSELVYFDINR